MSQQSAYFRLAADLVRSKYGTLPSHLHFLEDAPMPYQPKDRVTVPAAGGGRVAATVVTTFCSDYRTPETAYALCVQLDGDAPEKYETVALDQVAPLDRDVRPGDDIAPYLHYPPSCEVCGDAPRQGSVYCSDRCQEIMEGKPNATERALDL